MPNKGEFSHPGASAREVDRCGHCRSASARSARRYRARRESRRRERVRSQHGVFRNTHSSKTDVEDNVASASSASDAGPNARAGAHWIARSAQVKRERRRTRRLSAACAARAIAETLILSPYISGRAFGALDRRRLHCRPCGGSMEEAQARCFGPTRSRGDLSRRRVTCLVSAGTIIAKRWCRRRPSPKEDAARTDHRARCEIRAVRKLATSTLQGIRF